MRKLFSLVCGIFVLYSAMTVSASFSNTFGPFPDDDLLECQLTQLNPSMVLAAMEDTSLRDVSGLPFTVSVIAQKFGELAYNFESCFLHVGAGGGSEQDNVHEVLMKKADTTSNLITYTGTSIFSPYTALGKFKVYCPLIAPNLEQKKVAMSVIVELPGASFVQSSSNCTFHPSNSIADKIEVESNLSDQNEFVVKITGLNYFIENSRLSIGFTTHSGTVPEVTLGTTSNYYFIAFSSGAKCTVNGKESLVRARAYHGVVELYLKTKLVSGGDYTISCPDITTAITKGSKFIPSIINVFDHNTYIPTSSMAVNTYH